MIMPFVSLDSIDLAAWNVGSGRAGCMMVDAHNTMIERRMYDIPTLSSMRREGDSIAMLDVLPALISTIK